MRQLRAIKPFKTSGRTEEEEKLEHKQCNLAICLRHMNMLVLDYYYLDNDEHACKQWFYTKSESQAIIDSLW